MNTYILPQSIDNYEFVERSSIKEFDGNLTKDGANYEAFIELINTLKGNNEKQI